MKNLIVCACVLALGISTARAQLIWVNEFHYDNSGADSGEFIEVAVPASVTDLSSVTLTLYRGSDGSSYGSHRLSTFTAGGSSSGYTFYNKNISGLQNGPDGFALDQSGAVLQFLSYEDSFQAHSGAASGLTSTDIGVSESSSTSIGASLGLTGMGANYPDFHWATFSDDSPGALNTSQSFSAVPEPREYAFFAGLGLLGFAISRRCWKTQTRSLPSA